MRHVRGLGPLAALALATALLPSRAHAQESAPPVPEPGTSEVHVELHGSVPELSFYFVERGDGAPSFCAEERWRPECVHHLAAIQPLCVAPCSVDLSPSVRSFAVSRPGVPLVLIEPALALDRDGRVEVRYRSARPARVAGKVVLATLLSFAGAAFVTAAWTSSDRLRRGFGLGGLGALAVGLTVGFVLVLRPDEAALRFEPAAPALTR